MNTARRSLVQFRLIHVLALLAATTVAAQELAPPVPVLVPESVELNLPPAEVSAGKECDPTYKETMLAVPDGSYSSILDPEFRKECQAALAYVKVEAAKEGCPENRSIENLHAAVLDRCEAKLESMQPKSAKDKKPTARSGAIHLQAAGEAVAAGSLTGAASGAALTFTDRAIYGLADFAISTAKEGLIEEVANEFAKRLCSPEKAIGGFRTVDLFSESCEALHQRPASTGTTAVSYVALASFGRTFQEALRRDVDNLLPVVLTEAPGAEDLRRLLPVFLSLRDVVSKKVEARVIATRLLDTSCRDTSNARICEALQLAVVAAASAFDSGCKDEATCRQLLGELLRKHAILKLDEWARRKNVPAACLAALPLSANRDELRAWATGCGFAELIADDLLVSNEIADAPLWRANELTVVLREAALKAARDVHAGTSAVASLRGFADAIVAASEQLLSSSEEREKVRTLIARIDPRLFDAADIALDLYRLSEGVRRGDNPLTLSIAAARRVPCTGASSHDLGCGIRFLGVAGDAFLVKTYGDVTLANVRRDDPQKYFEGVKSTLTRALAQPENREVRDWLMAYLSGYGEELDGIVAQLGGPVLDVNDALKSLRTARNVTSDRAAAVDAASEELAHASFRLWRAALEVGAIRDPRKTKAIAVLDDVEETWVAMRKRDYTVAITSLSALAGNLNLTDSPIPDRLAKYTPLITAFAGAKSPQEVSQAIEQFAVTAPSARAKQTFSRSVGLDLLIGGSGGIVWDDGEPTPELALFVPLGIDFTEDTSRFGDNAGVFVSLIDIGSVVAVRYRDGETQTTEHLDWRDFVAPGVFFRRAVRDTSFVWGAGVTLTSPFEGDGAERALRLNAFFAFDRPILAFISRQKQ